MVGTGAGAYWLHIGLDVRVRQFCFRCRVGFSIQNPMYA